MKIAILSILITSLSCTVFGFTEGVSKPSKTISPDVLNATYKFAVGGGFAGGTVYRWVKLDPQEFDYVLNLLKIQNPTAVLGKDSISRNYVRPQLEPALQKVIKDFTGKPVKEVINILEKKKNGQFPGSIIIK